ncbi:hypothetical protein Gpo141_00008136 [Globisporangium polare]
MPTARQHPSPLVSVQLALCAETTSSDARAQATALPHVITEISDFLDCAVPKLWTLPRACEANLLSILPRLDARGVSANADPYFWRYPCSEALVFAVKNDNLEMVEWLHAYCPGILPYNAFLEAARTGNIRLLEWLSDRHGRTMWLPRMADAAASTGQKMMLEWLHNRREQSVIS